MVLHGFHRLTVDLDVVIALDRENALSAMTQLGLLGFIPRVPVDAREFAEESNRQRWIEEKGMTVFSMIHPKQPFFNVDLFVDPPIEFEELSSRSVQIDLGGMAVTVCSMEDLIRMKGIAGRTQDLMDMRELQRIMDARSQRD